MLEKILKRLAVQARVMRVERGMSQEEVAVGLGTSQNAVHRLEDPGREQKLGTLVRVAEFYGVELEVRFVKKDCI